MNSEVLRVNPHLWWYVARASGITAWVLLCASVVFGLWVSIRLTRKRIKPAWVLDLHRFLGGLALVFTAVHLGGLVADGYVHFGPSELFVPFASAWKPGPVAWGVVGLYLLLAVELTSLVMRRIPRRFWRAVHFSSYPLFVVATVHTFAAGTDSGNVVLQWAALVGTTAVVFLTVTRVLAGRPKRAVVRSVAPSAPERVTRAA